MGLRRKYINLKNYRVSEVILDDNKEEPKSGIRKSLDTESEIGCLLGILLIFWLLALVLKLIKER